jgi:hypothetical protein
VQRGKGIAYDKEMKLEMNVARWRNKERKKKYGKQSMKKE